MKWDVVYDDQSVVTLLPDVEPPSSPLLTTSDMWRVPHDIERIDVTAGNFRFGGPGFRSGRVRSDVIRLGKRLPEVYRAWPDHTTPIGEAHQWQWRRINPDLSDEKFCTLLGDELAWTNNSGFWDRRNYILNRNMTAQLPNFHAVVLNGGAIVRGVNVNGIVYIKAMLISEPVISPQALLADPSLWCWGTSVDPKGAVHYMTKLGISGERVPVRKPHLVKQPVWLKANELHKLPAGIPIPDARWMA